MPEQQIPPPDEFDQDDEFATTLELPDADADVVDDNSDDVAKDSDSKEAEKKPPLAQTGIASIEKDRSDLEEGQDQRIQDAGFTMAKDPKEGKGVDAAATFDGLGGYGGGHDASRIAAEEFQAQLAKLPASARTSQIALALETAWKNADSKIQTDLEEGLTTVSAVVVTDTDYLIAHVGDSRAYAINSNGELRQLTEDDADVLSFIPTDYQQEFKEDLNSVTNQNFQQLVDKWQATAKSTKDGGRWNQIILDKVKNKGMSLFEYLYAHRNAVNSALGRGEGSVGRIKRATRRKDDILVFTCSDGVHDNLTTAEIQAVIDDAFDNKWTPQQFADALAQKAHEVSLNGTFRSKEDDINVSCVEVVPPAQTEEAAGEATNAEATDTGAGSDLEGDTVRGIDQKVLQELRNLRPTVDIEIFPEDAIKLDIGEKIQVGREVFGEKDFKIGEGKENLVVSRQHATIKRDSLGFSIYDVGSRFGTYVNGTPVEAEYLLKNGDVITLGKRNDFEGPKYQVEILGQNRNAIRLVELDANASDQAELNPAEKLPQPENVKDAFYLLLSDEFFDESRFGNLAKVQSAQRKLLRAWGWLPANENRVSRTITFTDPTNDNKPLHLNTSTLEFLSRLNTFWAMRFYRDNNYLDVDVVAFVTSGGIDQNVSELMELVKGDERAKPALARILRQVFEEKQRQLKSRGQMPTQYNRPTSFGPPPDFSS